MTGLERSLPRLIIAAPMSGRNTLSKVAARLVQPMLRSSLIKDYTKIGDNLRQMVTEDTQTGTLVMQPAAALG